MHSFISIDKRLQQAIRSVVVLNNLVKYNNEDLMGFLNVAGLAGHVGTQMRVNTGQTQKQATFVR